MANEKAETEPTISKQLRDVAEEARRVALGIEQEKLTAEEVDDFARTMQKTAADLRRLFGDAARADREKAKAKAKKEQEAKKAEEDAAYMKSVVVPTDDELRAKQREIDKAAQG